MCREMREEDLAQGIEVGNNVEVKVGREFMNQE